jgi:hypothetical protein
MQNNILSFNGKQKIKDKHIQRMDEHIQNNQLKQNATGIENGIGCFIYCTLNVYNKKLLPKELGIPVNLGCLSENIYESLDPMDSVNFAKEYYHQISVGVDLSNISSIFIRKFADTILKSHRTLFDDMVEFDKLNKYNIDHQQSITKNYDELELLSIWKISKIIYSKESITKNEHYLWMKSILFDILKSTKPTITSK